MVAFMVLEASSSKQEAAASFSQKSGRGHARRSGLIEAQVLRLHIHGSRFKLHLFEGISNVHLVSKAAHYKMFAT